jgi:hypothetical protein
MIRITVADKNGFELAGATLIRARFRDGIPHPPDIPLMDKEIQILT